MSYGEVFNTGFEGEGPRGNLWVTDPRTALDKAQRTKGCVFVASARGLEYINSKVFSGNPKPQKCYLFDQLVVFESEYLGGKMNAHT